MLVGVCPRQRSGEPILPHVTKAGVRDSVRRIPPLSLVLQIGRPRGWCSRFVRQSDLLWRSSSQGIGDSEVDYSRSALDVVVVLEHAPPPIYDIHTEGPRLAVALALTKSGCFLDVKDMALPEGPRYNLMQHIVVSCRYLPRSTAIWRVDLGDIIPTAKPVA